MATIPLGALRACTKCNVSFPATADFFFRCSRTKLGLKALCKKCSVALNREHQRADRQRNPEKYRAWGKAWCDANRDKVRKRVRDWHRGQDRRDYHREWSEKNRDHVRAEKRAIEHRRRALKRQSEGSHTKEDVAAIYEAQGGKCFYCQVEVGNVYHVDHFIPLREGGSNDPSNLRVACPFCNRSKGYKFPWDWMPLRFTKDYEF